MKRILSVILSLVIFGSFFAMPAMAANDGDKCSVDIYSEMRNTSWATWWNDNNRYAFVDATSTERAYYQITFDGNNNNAINTNNEHTWDLFPNMKNGYFKITLKVPEGKAVTGNTYVEIADYRYRYNVSADVSDQIATVGEWIDVIVPISKFTAKDFDYSTVRRLQIRTTYATEFYVSGVGIYYTPQKYYDICTNGKIGNFWLQNFAGGNRLINNVGQDVAIPLETKTDETGSYYNLKINHTNATADNAAFNINCNDNSYPMILNGIWNDAFIRLKMRCSVKPSALKFQLTDSSWKGSGLLDKTSSISGWKANEWFTIDVPLKEVLYNTWAPNFKPNNCVRITVFVGFGKGSTYDWDIQDIGIYGPERKFKVLDFQILKDGTPVSEYNAGDTLTLSASTYNTLDYNHSLSFVGAVYDDDTALNDVSVSKASAKQNAGNETITTTFTVPSDAAKTDVKAFIFDSLENLRPLTASVGAAQAE